MPCRRSRPARAVPPGHHSTSARPSRMVQIGNRTKVASQLRDPIQIHAGAVSKSSSPSTMRGAEARPSATTAPRDQAECREAVRHPRLAQQSAVESDQPRSDQREPDARHEAREEVPVASKMTSRRSQRPSMPLRGRPRRSQVRLVGAVSTPERGEGGGEAVSVVVDRTGRPSTTKSTVRLAARVATTTPAATATRPPRRAPFLVLQPRPPTARTEARSNHEHEAEAATSPPRAASAADRLSGVQTANVGGGPLVTAT